MIIIASQTTGGELTPVQRAVRDHLTQGGSIAQALLVMLILLGAVLLVYFLSVLARKVEQRDRLADPRRLFQDVLGKLNLTTPQRGLLTSMAKDSGLEDPTVFLLSPALFDRYIRAWQERQRRPGVVGTSHQHAVLIAKTRRVLFPDV